MRIFQPDREYLRNFVARSAVKMSGRVLDIGGGNRRYAPYFTHCDYKTCDADASQKPDITGSVELLPVGDAELDGIICTQVLGDVRDPQKAIREIARTLKSGGMLILSESLLNEEHDASCDYWRFTKHAWTHLLEGMFRIEVMEPRGGYFSSRAQLRTRYLIEKYDLYRRPLLGRLMNLCALVRGKYGMWRDAHAKKHLTERFTIGYCILAVRI